MKTKRTFYRVITPSSFSDLNANTLVEAQKILNDFGKVRETSEYYQYWQDQRAACRIVKVTEIEEDIT